MFSDNIPCGGLGRGEQRWVDYKGDGCAHYLDFGDGLIDIYIF